MIFVHRLALTFPGSYSFATVTMTGGVENLFTRVWTESNFIRRNCSLSLNCFNCSFTGESFHKLDVIPDAINDHRRLQTICIRGNGLRHFHALTFDLLYEGVEAFHF